MKESLSPAIQDMIKKDNIWIKTTAYLLTISKETKITRDLLSKKGYIYYMPVSLFLKYYDLFRLGTYEFKTINPLFIWAGSQDLISDGYGYGYGYNSPVIFTNWDIVSKEKAFQDIKIITKAEPWLDSCQTLIQKSIDPIGEFQGAVSTLDAIHTIMIDNIEFLKSQKTYDLSSTADETLGVYNKLLENAALPKSNSSKKERKSMNTMTNFINKFNFGAVSKDTVKMTLYGPAFATGAGTYIAYDKTKKEYIDATEFQLPVDGLFYNIPIVAKDLDVGDFIKHPAQKNEYVRVTEIKDGKVTGEAVSKGEVVTLLPTKSPFGFNFYTKLFAPFDMNFMGGEADKDNPFGNILPFILLNDKDGKGLDVDTDAVELMTTMSMIAAIGGSNKINPLTFLLLNKSENSTNNLLPLILFSGGFMGNKSE